MGDQNGVTRKGKEILQYIFNFWCISDHIIRNARLSLLSFGTTGDVGSQIVQIAQ